MGRRGKKRKWIKPIELTGILGVIVLLLILSTSWLLDIGEAKISNETSTHQKDESPKETSAIDQSPTNPDGEADNELDGQEVSLKNDNAGIHSNEEGPVKGESDKGMETPSDKAVEQQVTDNEKTIYITFDDGPNENTEAILQLLDQYDAKATFFMLEPNMRKFKYAVQHMVEKGHSVGSHGVTHDVSQFYQSSDSVVSEMLTAQSTLESITGIHSELIRVPYGSVPNMTPEYLEAVKEKGFTLWDWNVDSEDWKFNNGQYVQSVMNQLASFPYGDQSKIILMHEKHTTLAHLESLLQKLTAQGYKMEAITDQMNPVTF
ncbi:polysaccharide deacetylase [Bacillus sp. BHET2]|uniref:polysaccharide deacetylase family protein n=1 Tax=Bacillus sp. BHET2 TaxID=2583818 RepID=UPI00110F3F5D|nr:polysaccharide deacetylase family protein [Bacillus sp. BHET2]TMU84348.1 polysaccharide deacetylase [Bacillus sp. BHET2]